MHIKYNEVAYFFGRLENLKPHRKISPISERLEIIYNNDSNGDHNQTICQYML